LLSKNQNSKSLNTMSSSPTPTDGLPRPAHVNKKSHPMNTRSGKTPSPLTIDASEGSWPTPAEAAHVKSIKHSKFIHSSPMRSPNKQSVQLSPANKTPHQSRTTQEPRSAVSEERRRQKVSLAELRFREAKEFMDEMHGSSPSISKIDEDGFLDEACNGSLLRIFVEKVMDRMHVKLKSDTSSKGQLIPMQNAIYFMNACSQLGVSVDIMLNTTDILHRRITPVSVCSQIIIFLIVS
jgi:hypothetical protein